MESPDDKNDRVLPYSTDCYAEFYDLWCDSLVVGRHAADEETYWEAIQTQISSHNGKETPINVIEIGTGSGRCLKDLLERAYDGNTPLPHVRFYGVDPAKPMLKRGKAYFQARPELQKIAPVQWVDATGENFIDVLPHLKGAADLVMWTGGGFSHMCSEAQQLAFLQQVAAALRTGSLAATGLVLVYNQSIPSRMTAGASEIFEIPWQGRSEEDPRVVYRKSANEVLWKGPVRHDRWTVAIVRDGQEVHTEKIEHTLMNLNEEAWPQLVQKAGLRISHQKELGSLGIFYYLQKTELES